MTDRSQHVVCPACGTNPRTKNMGLTVFDVDYGIAHCFKCQFVENNRNSRKLSPAERQAFGRRMDALRRQHDAEQRQRQADAAAASAIRWAAAEPASEHEYLARKGVRAHGIRIESGHTLLIPMRDTEGRLHSLQAISPDGEKRFMPGGRVKGCYCSIGKPSGRLVICEFSRPTNRAFRTVYTQYLVRALPRVAGMVAKESEAYTYLADTIQAWPDQDALGRQIKRAGWSRVAYRNLSGGIVALHRATRDDAA